MRGFVLVVVAMLVMFLWVIDLHAQSNDDAIVKQVLDGWAKRRTAMKTVRYRVEGTMIHAKGSLTSQDVDTISPLVQAFFPKEDVSFKKSMEYAFDFVQRRSRSVTRDFVLDLETAKFAPRYVVWTCDGNKTAKYAPNLENTSEAYTPHHNQNELTLYDKSPQLMFATGSLPILLPHGFFVLYKGTIDELELFKRQYSPQSFGFHARGAEPEADFLILRSIPEAGASGVCHEITVDAKKDCAVVVWKRISRNVVTSQSDIQYQSIQGHWLPASWRFDRFVNERGLAKFQYGERMSVTSIEVDPELTKDDFLPNPRPGALTQQAGSKDKFKIGEDGRSLVPIAQAKTTWFAWHWVAFLCGIAILFLGFWFLRQRIVRSRM
jgi:hypothetical protein